jgi:predicted SAM-dependent methyltransferase
MNQGKTPIRLNLGCGLTTPEGWINVDGSWNARLAKHPLIRRTLAKIGLLSADHLGVPWNSNVFIHDIRKPLPFRDESATAVYASHVLEHLYIEEGQQLVREAFRVLVDGGVLRVVVPDLGVIVQEYLNQRASNEGPQESGLRPADQLNQRLLMRWPSPSAAKLPYRIYSAWQDFHSHKWMYDLDSLTHLFLRTGFIEVERRNNHESRIEGIESVEDPSRILNGAGVCVEGIRPKRN